MAIKITQKEGIQIASFTGIKRFNLAVIEDVKTELKPILSNKETKMVIDFKDINYIDSSGIGCIISLVKTAQVTGAKLKLCGLSEEVHDIFKLLNLESLVDMEDDLESGIQKFL